MDQLNIYDAFLETLPAPVMWDCRETCRRFGESTDRPSWWRKEYGRRCLLPNSNTMKEVEFDNRAYIYCTLYERKK